MVCNRTLSEYGNARRVSRGDERHGTERYNRNVDRDISRRCLLAAAMYGCARKPRGYAGYAFVANQEGRSVAVVNLKRFTMARQIPLEAAPSAVIADPARPAVYVLTPENGVVSEIEAQPPALKRRA